jgi:hypothetical protein
MRAPVCAGALLADCARGKLTCATLRSVAVLPYLHEQYIRKQQKVRYPELFLQLSLCQRDTFRAAFNTTLLRRHGRFALPADDLNPILPMPSRNAMHVHDRYQ